jgi:ribosome-associated toxin RatA of RatAB toxin-antitoxin module
MRALLLALFLALPVASMAADETKPHPHQGVVAPYGDNPSKPDLTEDELAKLAAGELVKKQYQMEGGGRGMAIQDIHATPEVIWSKITDYVAYPKMVDEVSECEVYETSGDHIKARFVLTAFLMTIEYYIDHTYKPDEGFMTWTLDYSRESDLDDSVGYWRVEPHPTKQGWSRLYYSVDVRVSGWVPKAIETLVVKKGLVKATEWVKRESEGAS